jgi:signal transduction histidine kinase
MGGLLRPIASPAPYKALVFYVAQLAVGVVAFPLLIVGWVITLLCCITPLVVPLLIGLRVGVGLLAQAQAALARVLLGVSVHPASWTPGEGFWSRGLSVLQDRAFWKQQAHLLAAWPIALIPITLTYWALELIALPVWYRWADTTDVIGFIDVDSLGEALPFAGLGLVLALVVVHLLRPYAAFTRRLASWLLSGEPAPVRSPEEVRARRMRALTIDALISTAVVATLVAIWALTSTRYFWPIWPLLALSLVVGIPGWIFLVLERREISRVTLESKALAIQIGVSAVLLGFLVGVWAVTTGGYFWPIWPALCLALLAAVHAAVVYGLRSHRIEQLEESRAAAVDVQESEIRRIERDLHDGAQARLVALGMSLGRAEEKLATDPDGARVLLAEARTDALEALQELRDLARGIRPPILTDRGLEAAVGALVARAPLPVALSVDVSSRPPDAVETAAYFVVAEALANAIKHAGATRIDITVRSSDGTLVAEVSDDGRGGADAAGNGLAGLEQRVRALHGTLNVRSPSGGPTTVRAELPCA